jgi:hypothetical protein
MKITGITGVSVVVLAACIALQTILPAIDLLTRSEVLPGTVAGVAIGGTVETTPTNTLYTELQAQKQELDARQHTLESTAKKREAGLIAAIIVLSCMVVLNFYLDIKRNKKQTAPA